MQGEAKNLVFTLKPSPPQLLGISRSRDFTYSHLFLPLGILYLLYFLSLLFNKKKKKAALPCSHAPRSSRAVCTFRLS